MEAEHIILLDAGCWSDTFDKVCFSACEYVLYLEEFFVDACQVKAQEETARKASISKNHPSTYQIWARWGISAFYLPPRKECLSLLLHQVEQQVAEMQAESSYV